MTASASVVEAGRALVDALRAYGFPVSGGARASLTDGGSNEAYALNEAAVAFSDALNAPHPAEQDAREAWDRLGRVASGERVDRVYGAGVAAQLRLSADLRTLLALTQAAPDGWRLVPVEPTEAMIEAGRVVGSLRFANRASDTYRAMLSASPAPPAQGEGG